MLRRFHWRLGSLLALLLLTGTGALVAGWRGRGLTSLGLKDLSQRPGRSGLLGLLDTPSAILVEWLPSSRLLKRVDEAWARSKDTQSLRSFKLTHRRRPTDTCIFTMNSVPMHWPFAPEAGGTADFGASTSAINLAYALRHGYDFLRLHLPGSGQARALPWYKIPVVRELARTYAYVLYIDADAFVYQADLPLQRGIPELYGNATGVVWAAPDAPGYSHLNAGIQLFRTTTSNFTAFLDAWWDMPQAAARSSLCRLRKWPAEQGCLDYMWLSRQWHDCVVRGPEVLTQDVQHPAPLFIYHWTSNLPDEQRRLFAASQAANVLADVLFDLVAAVQR